LPQWALRYSIRVVPSSTPCRASAPDRAVLNVHVPLPVTLQAATVARRATRDALHAWELVSGDWADDVCLVVTELVTNAVRHGGAALALQLWFAGGCVTVAVDDGACRLPQPRAATDDDESGRGMLIVASLAGDWGVDARADGKRVWARFAAPAAAPHAEPDVRPRG
jgi:anti-sigma regulatory factor (Ser/Thr protein kinase)